MNTHTSQTYQPPLYGFQTSTSNLEDSKLLRQLKMQALKVISKMVSIVIVEQNLDTALALSTQGHVMERGRIVASGDVNQMHSSGLLEKLLAV